MKKRGYLQASIKEAIDNLPSGICFFDRNGLIVLCNRIMYRLAFSVTGRDLQTLYELEDSIRKLPDNSLAVRDGDTFILPDKSAWCFNIETITDEFGVPYTQVVASEVSEQYKGTKELAGNIEILKEAQAYIRSMTQNISAITRENEILSMKMRIHDELGSSLLRIRRYYLGTDVNSKAELLASWKNTVSMLKYKSSKNDDDDPIADLLRSAASIGVEIVYTGELPKNTAAARLIVRAIRECLTNAVRHAGGDRICVELTNKGQTASAVITNNGEPPKCDIVEGGGLSSLRRRIEKAGGTMWIQSLPSFALKVTVPVIVGNWQLSAEINEGGNQNDKRTDCGK